MFRAAISLRPGSPTLAEAFAAPQHVRGGVRAPGTRLRGEISARFGVPTCESHFF